MTKYQFAIDKKDGIITFIEVRNVAKDIYVSRNFIQGKGKDAEYYQVGPFAEVHSFDKEPAGIITKTVKPENYPQKLRDEDIRETISFLRNKHKELTSPEYQVAYDEFKTITHAMILDGIDNSPIDKFKDKGFTTGIQYYNEAVNLVKDFLHRGVIDPKKDISILPYLDRDIDNVLMFAIMSRPDKTSSNYKFKYDLNNNDTRISYISVVNPDKNFRVSRLIYEGEKESYEVGSSITFGTFARVHGFDITPEGIISERVNSNYWPKHISHADIRDAAHYLRNKYKELIQMEPKQDATMTQEKKGPYCVAAAEYKKGDKYEFSLVKPTNNHDPYVTLDPEGVKFTSHHSHIYKLSDDFKTAYLVRDNCLVGAKAPKQANLSISDYEGVKRSIQDLEAKMSLEQNQKPKSYLEKPEGLPDFPKLSKTDREDMNMFANNFLDSFPKADLTELVKLSPIALQMTKYGVQNCNGLIDTDKYDTLTKKQEVQIKEILKPYPGIGIRLDYECTGAAIKLQMPNGRTLNVPEYSSRKLAIGKLLER